MAHDGAKGFYTTFLEDSKLFSVGFGKTSERQMAVWDPRQLGEPLWRKLIDKDPGSLLPFFDDGTGLMFLGGKGDTIIVYELVDVEPYAHLIIRYTQPEPHMAIAKYPRRICDPNICEIDRFAKLHKNSVETVKFQVPRKSALFQEDIFPPAPAGVPALASEEWLAGKDAQLVTKAMKPEGAVSVFEVPESQGGKSRLKDEQRKAAIKQGESAPVVVELLTEGYLDLNVPGWFFDSWESRWWTVKHNHLYSFRTHESPDAIDSFHFKHLLKVYPAEVEGSEPTLQEQISFYIETDKAKQALLYLQADTRELRDDWVRSLQSLLEQFRSQAHAQAASPVDRPAVSFEGVASYLEELVPGWFGDKLVKRWYAIHGPILYAFEQPGVGIEEAVQNVHLDKVLSVHKTHGITAKTSNPTFQISTPLKVLNLVAPDEETRSTWVSELDKLVRRLLEDATYVPGLVKEATAAAEEEEEEEYVPDEQEEDHVHGWLDRKGFLFWGETYASILGTEICFYKNPAAPTPTERMSLVEVERVEEEQNVPETKKGKSFSVVFRDGSRVLFATRTVLELRAWIDGITLVLKQGLDIMKVLGIEVEEKDALPDLNFIDPTELKKGRQSVLIRISGKKKIRTAMVEKSWTSLESSGVYVLDTGLQIYQWNGAKASRICKAKALDLTNILRMKERGGQARIVVLDQGKTDNHQPAQPFWKVLGRPSSDIGTSQEPTDEGHLPELTVYRLVDPDSAGRKKQKQITICYQNVLLPKKELLYTKNVYVVDAGAELFVWQGRNSTPKQRKLGIRAAKALQVGPPSPQAQSSRPPWTSITLIFEFGENTLFKEKFLNYPGMLPIATTKQEVKSNVAVKVAQPPPTAIAEKLYATKAPQQIIFDDGSGRLAMWKVADYEKIPVDPQYLGQLWSGDSFILLYTYVQGNKEKNVIYFWQGSASSISEKGTSAYLTVELEERLGGNAVQVRVMQGKETLHFCSMFKQYGGLLVHQGKFDDRDVERNALFKIRGTTLQNTVAQETTCHVSWLFSYNAYVLRTSTHLWLWYGKHHSVPERERSVSLAAVEQARQQALGRSLEVVPVTEGDEPVEFWVALGGLDPAFEINYSHAWAGERKPVRLYRFHLGTGAVDADQEFGFIQEDLSNNHVMVLDAFHEVFIWFGAAPLEDRLKRIAMETVKHYVANSPVGHAPNTPIGCISAYHEPQSFRSLFSYWRPELEFTPKVPGRPTLSEREPWPPVPVDSLLAEFQGSWYTYEELVGGGIPGIDRLRLESYLIDEEFQLLFKMSRAEFAALPGWKQQEIKKGLGLY